MLCPPVGGPTRELGDTLGSTEHPWAWGLSAWGRGWPEPPLPPQLKHMALGGARWPPGTKIPDVGVSRGGEPRALGHSPPREPSAAGRLTLSTLLMHPQTFHYLLLPQPSKEVLCKGWGEGRSPGWGWGWC